MSLKLKIFIFFLVAFALLGAANNPKGDGLAVQGTDPTGNSGYPLAVVPATGSGAFPVSGTFWQATQPVSLASMPSTPVTGTFWQATQPVSGTFWQGTQPVSGTFWQATQPVSIASMPSTPVTGTFWQATQPVSGTVTANQGGTWTVQPGNIANTTAWNVSPGNSTGKTNVLKTASITTTSASADQVILTYTVTSGKTFYVEYLELSTRLTVLSATGTILGTVSLETPSGTKVFTDTQVNPTSEAVTPIVITFPEPIPVAAGVVIRVVCTPAATTSMLWTANFGGYEKT